MCMRLPSLQSMGSDPSHHAWMPSSPRMGSDSQIGDHSLPHHAQLHLIAFGLKSLREGEWKERMSRKACCIIFNVKFTVAITPKAQRRGCFFFIIFQTFKLIPKICLIIKNLISTKISLSALEYDFLKVLCVCIRETDQLIMLSFLTYKVFVMSFHFSSNRM